MRLLFVLLLVLCVTGDVQAQMSGGFMFPGPGSPSAAGGACANNAPDGTVDLSKCSNAFYVATLIFG
jgi:hypothetical protein